MNAPHSLDHLLSFCIESPWALTRSMLAVVANVLGRRLASATTDASELRAQSTPVQRRPGATSTTGIALIPIHGVIAPRMNMLSDVSGGTSYHQIRAQLNAAIADPDVKTIVLDVDSPGGSCAGTSECAHAIMAARQRKPVVAVAEYQMASAAYWLASSATEIVASPSAQVGSIGVFTIHEDLSKALDIMGVKLSIISAGKYKTDGHPAAPLSDSARARIQQQVDRMYRSFVADVAHGRRTSDGTVRNGFGQGAVVDADEALKSGMVDSIETLEATIERVLTTPPSLQQPLRVTSTPPPALNEATRLALAQRRHELARATRGGLHSS